MTLTQNNYRLTFTFAAVPSFFAIFLLLYFVQKPNRLQTKHYGVPKYPARPAPSKHRHGRGPLARIGSKNLTANGLSFNIFIGTSLTFGKPNIRVMSDSLILGQNFVRGRGHQTLLVLKSEKPIAWR